MGLKKDNSNPGGLWISPPPRWLCVLIPLLVVVACGTFKNSYVYEQFRYSLSEKFLNWPKSKYFADEVGTDRNSAFEFQSRSFANGAAEIPAALEAHPPAEGSVSLESTLGPVEGPEEVSGGDKGQSKRPDEKASDLAAVRADLAEPVAAEASAHWSILELEKLSKANATEWTSRFPTVLERSEGMAQDLKNGGGVIECSAVRGQDRGFWAWREIDGRRCWYRGKPGRAKTLLRWSNQILPRAVSGAAAARPEIRDRAEAKPPKLPEVSSGSLWHYDGSTLLLMTDGAQRKIYYEIPRPELVKIGVQRGTLFFVGRQQGREYHGITLAFSNRCVGSLYRVRGELSEDNQTIVMRGKAPSLLDAKCRIVATYHSTAMLVRSEEQPSDPVSSISPRP